MAKLVLPKATTAIRGAATPLAGEILYDTDLNSVYIGNGSTQGGLKVYTNDLNNAFVYGVDRDLTSFLPSAQKVVLQRDGSTYTNVSEFSRMPVHAGIRRCVMDNLSTRHINYYLHPSDSNKKADGTAATLTGADGDVMVEFPVAYYRIDKYNDDEGHAHVVKLICDQAFPGSAPFPAFYVSSGGATLQTQYMGAFKGSIDANGKLRSISGVKPTVNKTRAQFRTAAVSNGGTNVSFLLKIWLGWLAEIEYGSTDTQSTISWGYSFAWDYDSSYLYNCGQTIPYGNSTGSLYFVGGITVGSVIYIRYKGNDTATAFCWNSGSTQSGTNLYTASATPAVGDTVYSDTGLQTSAGTIASRTADADIPWAADAVNSIYKRVISFCYRGVEDPWGACWEFEDGIQKYQDATAGDFTNSGYTFTSDTAKYTTLDTDQSYGAPGSKFPAAGYTGANTAWVSQAWPKASGYIKLYDPLTYFPTDVTGSNTTYLCDYLYNDASAGARVVFRGGYAGNGASDGAFYVNVHGVLTDAGASLGGRLAV